MDINTMADLIDKYGFLTVFGILSLALLYKYFNNKITKSKSNMGEENEMIRSDMIDNHNNESIKSLLMHPLFCNINNIIFLRIPNIDLGDNGRTRIFRDILLIQFTILLSNLRESIQTESITDENFLDKNLEILKNSIVEYEKEWDNYGIPEIVIKKYNEWILERYDLIFKNIQNISISDEIFDTVYSKQYVVLGHYESILSMIMIDAKDSLSTLNGELTGAEYRGITVGDNH